MSQHGLVLYRCSVGLKPLQLLRPILQNNDKNHQDIRVGKMGLHQLSLVNQTH